MKSSMLQLFRNFFKSKFGVVFTLVFLAVIGLAFASSDVLNSSMGTISGTDRIAVVGDEKIDSTDVQMAANNALEAARQQDPRITMQAFVATGGLEKVVDQLVDRAAFAAFARQMGLRAGNRLVDSELLQIPAFRGVDGKFSRETFLAVLRQQGLSEAALRQDMATTLLARQLATPVMASPVLPQSLGLRYSTLLRERREGAIAMLPSSVFAPKSGPTPAQLDAYYAANGSRYIRPERRVIRFASFGNEALKNLPAPTEAQIAERYNREKVKYAAIEKRGFTQVVAATQADAQAIAAAVKSGQSLEQVARAKGLATAKIAPVTQLDLNTSASVDVARAAFAAAQGALAAPARGGLGWYVLRIDTIDRQAARPLAQVRGEIVTALAEEQRRAALADLTARIEEEFDGGSSLEDMAKELGLTVATTAPATADGTIYGKPGERVAPALAPALATAFEMDEGEPQLAEVVPGQTFVIFDVSAITTSAVAPMGEIREELIAAWKRDEGAKVAKAAADRVMARVAKGTPLLAALQAEKIALPAPMPVNLTREQLAQRGPISPPLALMFSMAQGSVKKLQDAGSNGWFVVQLAKIEAGKIAPNDPIVAATLRQLGSVAGDEYAQQFLAAVSAEVKPERNKEALAALRRQLSGNGDN